MDGTDVVLNEGKSEETCCKSFKEKREEKRTSIVKLIELLDNLTSKGKGSRSRLSTLRRELKQLFSQAVFSHEEYMLHLEEDHEDYSDTWIEQLALMVDNCCAAVDTQLKKTMSSGWY